MFRGNRYSELYFNMTGYTGGDLPCSWVETRHTRSPLTLARESISAYRKEVARLNREWAEIDKERMYT